MAIHVLENYVSVEEYAELCGIKRRTVTDRIKSKLISAAKVDGYVAISTTANPPAKYIPASKKKPGGGTHFIHPELRCVVHWCRAKNIRCYPYLRAIITGHIEGWVIGGEVFARDTDLTAFRQKQ